MTPAEVRAARAALDLTQKQLAPLLGLANKSRVHEYENGQRTPSAAAVRLLRAYLDGYRPEDWPGPP